MNDRDDRCGLWRTADGSSRRRFLQGAGAVGVGYGLGIGLGPIAVVVRPALPAPAGMHVAISRMVGGATLNPGRIQLQLPPLSENGNSVPCKVTVASPMTAADHVRAIHVVNEKNPQPNVISARLGPRAGKAEISTRIRLSDSQTVVAIAELSDGSFWSDQVEVVVTLGACLEEPI